MTYGGDVSANALLTSLLQGEDVDLPSLDFTGFTIPASMFTDLTTPVERLTNADLTTESIDGTGLFDSLMRAMKSHLLEEYQKNRITGSDFTKAYIACMETAVSGAIQYLTSRDSASIQAQGAQMQTLAAVYGLATSNFQALTAKSEYGLTKMKIASEDAAYGASVYQTTNILPQNLALLKEQTEAQRGQTLDTRTDGSTIAGSMGEQKALYAQQITSYQRASEVAAAKIFSDAWITMKTIDEGLDPPTNFDNANLNNILATLMVNNALATPDETSSS